MPRSRTASSNVPAPGSVPIHYDETGFFREVYENDYGVIDGIKKYISYLPAYNPGVLPCRRSQGIRCFRQRTFTASSR